MNNKECTRETYTLKLIGKYACERNLTTEQDHFYLDGDFTKECTTFCLGPGDHVSKRTGTKVLSKPGWQKVKTIEWGLASTSSKKYQETDGAWSASHQAGKAEAGVSFDKGMKAGAAASYATAGAGIEGTPLYAQAQGPAAGIGV